MTLWMDHHLHVEKRAMGFCAEHPKCAVGGVEQCHYPRHDLLLYFENREMVTPGKLHMVFFMRDGQV